MQGAFLIFGIAGDTRVPYLLHYVGSSAFDVLCDRLDPVDPFTQQYDTLVQKLEEFYEPAPLEIAENYKFHQRTQETGETVQQYVAALHKLSIHCKFGEYLKTALLRNQFVFGLQNKKSQARLLERKDLNFEEAVKIAVTMELSEKSSEQMKTGNAAVTTVDYLKTGKKPQNKQNSEKNIKQNYKKSAGRINSNFHSKVDPKANIKCYRCGKAHLASKCTLSRDVQCFSCGKNGHLNTVCFKKSATNNQLQEILALEHNDQHDKYFISLKVNDKLIKFKIDSGSAVTVISELDLKQYFPNTVVQKTNLQLISYCGSIIQSKGFITVNVKFKNIQKKLNIYIVKGHRKPLLGREWLRQLSNERDFLICSATVNMVSTTSQSELHTLLDKYKKLSPPEFSAIKDIQAKLTLKTNVTPVFIRTRPVPFKLIPLVE